MTIPLPERFNFISTQDGSPSLRFKADENVYSESMHNLNGAFGETIYIYGKALEKVVELGLNPHVISLGLGLGYNEIISAAVFAKNGLVDTAKVDSFEIDPLLREYFAAWFSGAEIPAEFRTAYEQILTLATERYAVEADAIRSVLKTWQTKGQLRLREALSIGVQFDRKYSCFLFDAFSSKTSPELWSEEFLVMFLEKTAEPRAVFSTYACTGALKRALRASGFELEIREGFSSKRDCTFAVR